DLCVCACAFVKLDFVRDFNQPTSSWARLRSYCYLAVLSVFLFIPLEFHFSGDFHFDAQYTIPTPSISKTPAI
ncbi:hypothetical protein BCR44DRAFT_1428083, partial [Catenaria anguillulae PL171]